MYSMGLAKELNFSSMEMEIGDTGKFSKVEGWNLMELTNNMVNRQTS
jgi:hypothetical protein